MSSDGAWTIGPFRLSCADPVSFRRCRYCFLPSQQKPKEGPLGRDDPESCQMIQHWESYERQLDSSQAYYRKNNPDIKRVTSPNRRTSNEPRKTAERAEPWTEWFKDASCDPPVGYRRCKICKGPASAKPLEGCESIGHQRSWSAIKKAASDYKERVAGRESARIQESPSHLEIVSLHLRSPSTAYSSRTLGIDERTIEAEVSRHKSGKCQCDRNASDYVNL